MFNKADGVSFLCIKTEIDLKYVQILYLKLDYF